MKVYEAVARALGDAGVDTMFGLMGDANMLYVTAFSETGRQFVAAVSEGSAVSMADGFSRFGGGVGVVTVTHGPGATNAVTALTEAVRARTPLILLTGDTPAAVPGHGQVLDLAKIADLAGASYAVSRRSADCVDDLRRAITSARKTRRPVLLNLPVDFMLDQVTYTPSRPVLVEYGAPHVDVESEAFDAALGIIAAARRPVVIAGRGAAESGAREAIIRLSDVIGAPLGTTLMAQGLFAGHPLNIGIIGTVGHVPAMDAVSAADCVIAFGASLNRHTSTHGFLFDGKRVIQCDVDPTAFGKTGQADVEIVGDARQVAELLADALSGAGIVAPGSQNEALRAALCEYEPLSGLRAQTDVVDMRIAVSEFNAILPRRRQVVTDCGRFLLAAWKYLEVDEPLKFTHAVHFGSIGLGLATGIGASVRDRSCPTVVVAGDGGAMMSLIELQTATRLGLPLVVLILNDGCYGAEYLKLQQYGVDPKHSLLSWPEFGELAVAMGAHARTVRRADDFAAVGADIAESKFPLVVDVKCDPSTQLGEE